MIRMQTGLMNFDEPAGPLATRPAADVAVSIADRAAAGVAVSGGDRGADSVTALYQVHAGGLVRLAVVMLRDHQAAEDVVQEAFCGLYRRWTRLADQQKALGYLRSAVVNGCRSELRRRIRRERRAEGYPVTGAASAEQAALIGEEHREVLAALRRLPRRQREVLALRFYLELSEPEVAESMGISQGTVKSTTSRALAALGRLLGADRVNLTGDGCESPVRRERRTVTNAGQ
jgi:RNA polymerase sigma-70 factor (sigma-E family)